MPYDDNIRKSDCREGMRMLASDHWSTIESEAARRHLRALKGLFMKPHVICLMACSVDGRTLPSRWRPKGAAGDLFERVHDELAGDAWLIGRVTGQEFAKGKPYPATTTETFPREPWLARRDAKAYGIVLDTH